MNLQVSPEAPAILHALAAAVLFAHIAGGTVGMISGGVAMFARKGGRLHRISGTVFFLAMLTMASVAAVVSPMLDEARWTNTTAAVFTLYLIASAWVTVRRRPGQVGRFERAAVIVPLGIAAMAVTLALVGRGGGFETVYAFGAVSALAAACDLRMIRRGGVSGADRTARHLWRMSAALFVATGSFFFGQPDFQPDVIRNSPIPTVLGVAPLVLLVFWMLRVKFARAFRPAAALAMLLAVGASLPPSDALAGDYRAPRTRHGAPNLEGIWTNTSVTWLQRSPAIKSLVPTDAEAAAMEAGFAKMVESLVSADPIDPEAPAPAEVKDVGNSDLLEMDMRLGRVGGQVRSSWIVEPADGRLPFTDAGRAATREFARNKGYDGPEIRPTEERCLTAIGSPEGPPMMNAAFNAHYQIVQTRDHVAIHIEMNHDVRIVRLADRTHPHDTVRPWMGDSVGWWEGDTLVVETTNLNPRGAFVSSLAGGFAYSREAKVMERFTRTAKDRILYQFTVEDPATFARPWRAEMEMRAAKGPIYEYACHEGNYSLPNILAGAREQERAPKP